MDTDCLVPRPRWRKGSRFADDAAPESIRRERTSPCKGARQPSRVAAAMAPEDFNPDYLVPGTRIGAYVVRGLLGQGGSSSVYEVESAEGHRFALKICRYHGGAAYGTSEWRVDQRYSRSIICLQLLKGRRNVAELFAHDRHPDPLHGFQYLVQELVPGGLLITDWVKRESPPLRKLVGAFAELADLCGVMAGMGICHRDLKPPNILVTPDGTPKVIDFESATCPPR